MATMWLHKINHRAYGYYQGGVDGFMAAIVMGFGVLHKAGISNTWHLIEVSQVTPKVGIIYNTAQIALKMAHIHCVKTY